MVRFSLEPGLTVPFATHPHASLICAPRYTILFGRVDTQRFLNDVAELRTYDMDVRQILTPKATVRNRGGRKDIGDMEEVTPAADHHTRAHRQRNH